MVRTQTGIEQLAAKRFRVCDRFERQRVFGGAWHAEILRDAAHGQHQRVECKLPRRQDFAAVGVVQRVQRDVPVRAIERGEFALFEFETMPLRLHRILQLMRGRIELARGGFVQQGLPEVRRPAVDQHDLRETGAPSVSRQTRGEPESAHAATDDHDPMRRSPLARMRCSEAAC